MTEWIALSRTRHTDSHFLPRQGYAFAADRQVTPILLAELGKLLPHYPLGFVQQGDQFQPVALLGLSGPNRYLHPDGRWMADYVPAGLRGYPFTLANAEDNQQVLCIDHDHIQEEPNDSVSEALFDDEGSLSQRVQQTLDFLQQCESNRQLTIRACQTLGELGLIEPWPLQIGRGEDQTPLQVQGLFRINEKALNALEPTAFADLRKHGALALAYAQLFSLNQLHQLIEREKFHARQQPAQSPNGNLDSLFGEDDDLSFDFGD
ncbi:SapC family protein [Salinicola sp. LHM]|uniref:SapC family protein n=1 Tax=Salinicola sp. LHM TaxID=3065298 RepID=UPI002ACD25B0|nr:SapC family protein [Salinicola sp. LHM]WQH34214.1 SapC family protein [Salinicola sp. LHM]